MILSPIKRKKGIIFALDGAIAATIILIMLVNTTYYFTSTSRESLSQTQVIKRGYDVISMFDESGQLDDALRNEKFADLNVYDFLPSGYNMSIDFHDGLRTECTSSCLLSSGRIKTPLNTLSLTRGGNLHVQVNAKITNAPSGIPALGIGLNTVQYAMTSICASKGINDMDCTYTTTGPVPFPTGITNLNVVSDGSNNFEVHWLKVLDDPSYTFSTRTEAEIPDDQFIGSGERWYAGFDDDTREYFEGMHKVRFRIWLQ
ncbi:hypothetical protein HOB87_09390 [Candidatus Woesearchaeota archaeon]|nr:hypothetical protein [Candidatus Woesearchaeota archaeon]MBT5043317.1 hypothetical protein [Candidatus Woesearchaeota archaeon]